MIICLTLEINGQYRLDDQNRNLFVPRALCVLSHQPFFSAFNIFLRELYRYAIVDTDDHFGEESPTIRCVDSFESLRRKGFVV